MTPKRAFWEALATVCIPSLVIWGVLLYFLRAQATADEWPLYLLFVALPLPLFFPLYNRYRKGIKYGLKNGKPWQHLTLAILFAVLSAAYSWDSLHRKSWDLAFHLTLAMIWLAGGADHFRRWAKTRASLPPDSIGA